MSAVLLVTHDHTITQRREVITLERTWRFVQARRGLLFALRGRLRAWREVVSGATKTE